MLTIYCYLKGVYHLLKPYKSGNWRSLYLIILCHSSVIILCHWSTLGVIWKISSFMTSYMIYDDCFLNFTSFPRALKMNPRITPGTLKQKQENCEPLATVKAISSQVKICQNSSGQVNISNVLEFCWVIYFSSETKK